VKAINSIALALALLAGAPEAFAEDSGSTAAPSSFVRTLHVETGSGGPVTATTTGFLDERFSGFSLVDAQGRERPFSLLNRAGSACTIHFDALCGESLSLLPLSQTTLPQPGAPIRSGLRHLARRYDGGTVDTVAQFESLWKDAPFLGGRFEDQVYASYNPFGANSNALHRYDGFIRIDKAGPTTFCVASTDASFLLIDDREAASWPGRHPAKAGLDGSKRGTIPLTAGLHRFTFLHANSGNDSFAIAAYVPPGDKQHAVIGPELFTRAAYAFVSPLASRDGHRQADFVWDNRYMVTMRDAALFDVAFEAASLDGVRDEAYVWTFGDGTQGAGRALSHLYFATGMVPVTLTVTLPDGRPMTTRQTIFLSPRYGQNENDDKRTLSLLHQAVEQERQSGIQPEGYALISYGLFFFLKEDEAAAFADRVLGAVDRIPETELGPLMNQYALSLQQIGERYELAERCFLAILDKAKDPALRASAALHYAGMLNLCLNRPQEARERLKSIRRQDLVDWEQRLLDIYFADTSMVLDDVATAQKLYAAIPKTVSLVSGAGVDRQKLFDYNSRYFRIQNLLSQHLYRESLPEVDLLEWELPEERASPRMNLLKVQALLGNNQPRKAVVCLQRALLAEVDETYTPQLRLALAKCYTALGQYTAAKHQIALIRKESPWTREEIDARQLLQEINEKIGEIKP